MFNNASNAIAGAEHEKMRQETAYNKTAHTVDAPDVSSLLRLADQVSEATARLDLEQASKLIQSLVETIAEKQRLLDNKDEDLTIKAVDAESRRMDAESRRIKEAGNAQANFANAGLDPDIRNIMADATANAMNDDLAETLADRRMAEKPEKETEPAQ